MLWIGVTGPIGGGKSTVSEILRDLGYVVLDADQIVHHILRPGGLAEHEVLHAFGPAIRDQDGHIDRRALGRIVFKDASALAQLESILHPKVRKFVTREKSRLDQSGSEVAFYDVPLLFEKKMQDQFDHVLVVTASEPVRRLRVKARSNWDQVEFDARAKSQLSAEYKEKMASVIVRNEGDLEDLKKSLLVALQSIGVPSPPATNP